MPPPSAEEEAAEPEARQPGEDTKNFYHFFPKKSLGQNWLKDEVIARNIVISLKRPLPAHLKGHVNWDSVDENQPIVEIGPGRGALTGIIRSEYEKPKYKFTAIELDQRWVAHLTSTYPDLDVRRMDVLETDWKALREEAGGQRLNVIGNLPYNITSEILFSFIESSDHIRQAVITMQLEVAKRLISKPRTKDYGILAVMLQLYCPAVEFLVKIPPTAFRPIPKVDSAAVRLIFSDPGCDSLTQKLTGEATKAQVRQVVRMAFNQRRKCLRNSLSTLLQQRERPLPERWSNMRPEELRPEQFIDLTRYLFDEVPYPLE